MVGVEDDHGVVVLAIALECQDDPADLVIDHRSHARRQRHRFLQFPLAAKHGGLCRHLRLRTVEIVVKPLHRRRRVLVRRPRRRRLIVIRIVHVPVFARRVERMMRIGERDKGKKRGIFVLLPVQIIYRPIRNPGRRIEILRDRRAVGLPTGVVVRPLIFLSRRSSQSSGLWAWNHCL